MWKNKIITLLTLLLCIACEAKTITIKPSQPLQQQFSQEGATYKIKSIVDLNGTELILPKDSRLLFKKKGIIRDGKLVGNNTRVTAKEKVIFDNLKIEGRWNTPIIYINWMSLSEKNCLHQVREVIKLQNDEIDNTIYTPSHSIHWTPKWDCFSLIELSSKAKLVIRDTIFTNPNNRPYYRVVNVVGKNNISINGGVLVGDVEDHIYDGETSHGWGFGVNVESCNDVSIVGTTSMCFTGDGFYLGGEEEKELGNNERGCKNVTLKGVRALYNRRQGMSVTASTDHLYVYDSEFSYTGTKKTTMPGAGVDFEVNYNNQRMDDIYFNKCVLKGNRKGLCLLNRKGNGRFVFEEVTVDEMPIYNMGKYQYEVYPFHGVILSGDYESIDFKKCQLGAISNMTTFNQELPNKVNIDNSTLSIVYTRSVSQSFLRSFKISNSIIDISNKRFLDAGIHDTETPKEITNLFYCASVVDFEIDNCEFLTDNTGIKSGFADTDRNASIIIKNCVLDKEMIFPHYNASFYNCHIKQPSFIWLALRKGMTSVWENNVIEITEAVTNPLSVTQIRGDGEKAQFIFRNNTFKGSSGDNVSVYSAVKDDCKIVYENSK